MPPARRPARSRLTGRGVARGSALGLGLLVATAAPAAPALADLGTTPDPGAATTPDAPDTAPSGPPVNDVPIDAPVPEGPGTTGPDVGTTGSDTGTTGSGTGAADPATTGSDAAPDAGAGESPASEEAASTPEGTAPGDAADPGAPAGAVATALFPDFGCAKEFCVPTDIQVQPGDGAPADLDLSGAEFTLTNVQFPEITGVCVTDQWGTCTVSPDSQAVVVREEAPVGEEPTDGVEPPTGNVIDLPTGRYTVEQTREIEGLVPAEDVDDIDLCMAWEECEPAELVTVDNASLFVSEVQVTAQDARTHRPLRGAGYRLTGSDYRHRVPVDRPASTVQPGTAGPTTGAEENPGSAPPVTVDAPRSGRDGVVRLPGPLLPGTWTLTPTATPAGYAPDDQIDVPIGAPATGETTVWSLTRYLAVPAAPDGDDADDPADDPAPPPAGGDGTDGPATPPAGGPASAPAPAPAPGGQGPRGGAGTPGTTQVDVPVDVPVDEPIAPPSPPSSAPTTASATRAAGTPQPVDPVARPTEVDTVNSSIPELGLVGFGILFVAAVVVAIGVLRRRVRERD